MNSKLKSNIYLWLTPIIWGAAFVAQRVGGEYLGAFTFNALRFALGAISLIPIILIFERGDDVKSKRKATLIGGAISGVLLFSASTLQQYGVILTASAGKAAFITGLYTVLVPVIGFFIGRKTSLFTWCGVAVSVVGLYLINYTGSFTVETGDILLLLCALLFAVQIMVIDRWIGRSNALRFSLVQTVVTAVLSGICALIFESCTLGDIGSAGFALIYGGVMSVGVAYTTQILGQRGSDPTYCAIVFSTESIFAAVSGILLLNESMGLRGYIGCALIFAGIILSQLKGKHKNDKALS